LTLIKAGRGAVPMLVPSSRRFPWSRDRIPRAGYPRATAEGIIATAKDKGCDLIVMASHGRRGLSKLILGSQATRVLALTTVPVLICR
jgi:hypothetical protein